MHSPATRLLSLLELLQSHGRLSGSDIAARLGVDKRTVRRYIRSLEDLGIPVTTEQGRDGGYMLVAGFKLPPMMFTNDETLALSLGLLAARQLKFAEADVAISGVQAKLERVMPAKLQARARAIAGSISMMLPEPATDTAPEHFSPLLDALEQQCTVEIVYVSQTGQRLTRRVDPYGLLFRRGQWYMTGYCHLRQQLRTFRLDRLRQIALLAHQFTRPQGFDSAAYFKQSLMNMPGNVQVEVLLHAAVDEARQVIGSTASLLKPQQNGLLLSTQTDCCQWFAIWLSQLPFAFSIIQPPELKQALQQHAQRLLQYSA